MIVKYATQIGDPVIRSKAKPIKNIISPATKKIVRDLIDSMRYHNLVGMAAPQIGIGARIFVTEIRETPTRQQKEIDAPRVFINPQIIRVGTKKVLGGEGCGSVAASGLFANVRRPEKVIVRAYNQKGERFTLAATGLLARIIQHENDHLNGIVFLDRLPDMKGLMSRQNYIKHG